MDKIQRDKKSPVTLKITGMFLSEGYQYSKILARMLRKYHKQYFREPVITGFIEVDWIAYLSNLQRTVGGQTWAMRNGVVVFIDGLFIGGDEELFNYYRSTYEYTKPSAETIKEVATKEYLDYLNKTNLLYAYMEFSLGQEYMGTLLIELQVQLLPKTCTKFASLCDSKNRSGVSYKGSTVFRICKDGWFQAGRVGVQRKMMQDESFCYPHDRRGVISFPDTTKFSNSTEFFITFGPSRWMDQRYLAFGRVVEGWDLLRRLENLSCTYESPDRKIVISDCGMAKAGYGKKMVADLRMRGITVGDPHIDLTTFQDILLDYLMAALFDRLDEEVKREMNREWVATVLWDTLEPFLRTREPVEDVPDLHDKVSVVRISESYFIDLLDLPQKFIKDVLNEILHERMEKQLVINLAKSIVSLILNTALYQSESELAVELILNDLIYDIEVIFFGSENGDRPPLHIANILSDILSKVIRDEPSLSSLVTNTSSTNVKKASTSRSVDKSLADFIWGILFNNN